MLIRRRPAVPACQMPIGAIGMLELRCRDRNHPYLLQVWRVSSRRSHPTTPWVCGLRVWHTVIQEHDHLVNARLQKRH